MHHAHTMSSRVKHHYFGAAATEAGSSVNSSDGAGLGHADDGAAPRASVATIEHPGAEFGSYTWPSAVVLAHYVWAHRARFSSPATRVIELGAGTALPGLLARTLGAHVTLTDYTADIIERCGQACTLNHFGSTLDSATSSVTGDPSSRPNTVAVLKLDWGYFTEHVVNLPQMDWVLGADVLYDPSIFEDLFATVAYFLDKNPDAVFVTAYQVRSADRCLDYYLCKWFVTF